MTINQGLELNELKIIMAEISKLHMTALKELFKVRLSLRPGIPIDRLRKSVLTQPSNG
jgi:hypothetical protein